MHLTTFILTSGTLKPPLRRGLRQSNINLECPYILTLLRSRSMLYKKCCASRTDDAWNAYKVKRNKCTASIRLAKRIYLLDSARHKPLMFWRQVKSCTGLGKTKRSLLPWPCSTPVISKSSANALNEHFIASVRSAIPSSNNSFESKCSINNTPNDVSYDKFSFREITVSDIASVINNIAASGSPGTDGISPHMLKFSLGSISSVLVSLFNRSIKLTAFSASWKIGFITPIHKRGTIFDMNNYRPISILPIISRIFERILSAQLRNYIEDKCLLSPQQHGFRLGRSCQTALISLTNRLFQNRNDGYFSAVAALDNSKAFDCLNHDILINSLRSCNLSLSCLSWFKSYLSGQVVCSAYDTTKCSPTPYLSPLECRSVFGPQLFNIYINSVLNRLPAECCVAYADDVTIIATGKSMAEVAEHLQSLLDLVSC